MIQALRNAVFPPVPEAIRGDFTLLRAARLQSQIPLLNLTLFLTIPTAIYGSSEGASPFIRFGLPLVMGSACLFRFFMWMRKRNVPVDLPRAAKMISAATWVSCALAVVCSTWCVMSWLSAPPAMRIYYPMILAMGSLATAYCLSTIRIATIGNLAIGLLPISLLLLFTGNRMDLAAGTSLVVASAFLLRMIAQQHTQLVDLLMLQRQMRELANTDPLTGLLNRRALFDLHGDALVGAFTAVVVFDLDNFKAINDEFGHAAGDEVLKVFARELAGNLGPADVAARMGGEEFALVLKRTLPETVEETAERIRTAFAARRIEIETGSLTCTVSAGFAFGATDGMSFDKVLSAADKALYAAKRGGRNRVTASAFRRAS